ncbi:hypothetical protein [Micromonospora tulbaghiae]
MIEFAHDTVVTFPAGHTTGESEVLAVVGIDPTLSRYALVVAETPFHPVDHRWPDQPADRGTVEVLGQPVPVVDCVIGAARTGTDAVLIGRSVLARRGEDRWCWLVLHVVELSPRLATLAPGTTARLSADRERRARLSAAHTLCHLSGLALNGALSGFWRKSVTPDSLANPDFEKYTLVASVLSETGFHDTYRIGRTVRKAGFEGDRLTTELPKLAATLAGRISAWTATAAPVRVHTDGPGLGDPRAWVCTLPPGTARIACGGTHVSDLAELTVGRLDVRLSPTGDTLEVDGDVATRLTRRPSSASEATGERGLV